MAHEITRGIVADLVRANVFSLIVDESTDISGLEQVSICMRYVDADLWPQEVFLGLIETCSTTGETLASLICDAMLRLGLPVNNLRGQCYYGAANMSGRFQGVQAKIGEKQPLTLYIHCSNHCLNLALQDCGKKVPLVRNTLQLVNEVGVLIRNSAKRFGQFRHFAQLLDVVCSAPRPLCPIRWTVRVKAITDVDCYPVLLRTLEEIASSTADAAVSARGLLMNFEKGEVVILAC